MAIVEVLSQLASRREGSRVGAARVERAAVGAASWCGLEDGSDGEGAGLRIGGGRWAMDPAEDDRLRVLRGHIRGVGRVGSFVVPEDTTGEVGEEMVGELAGA